MFQCYLDDSESGKVVALGGFIGATTQWEAMEPSFDEILNRYKVLVFHSMRFHNTDGTFRGWSKVKKRALIEELFTAAHGRMKGLCIAARRAEFVDEKKRTGKHPDMSPFGMLFSGLMIRTLMDPDIGPQARELGVALLVESGNANNAEIEAFFHKFSQHPVLDGALRSLTIIPKAQCRAIQMADFYAFYGRRHLQRHDRFDNKLMLPPEPYLEIMKAHVPYWEFMARGDSKRVGHLKSIDSLDELAAKVTDAAAGRSPSKPAQSSGRLA